MQFLRPLSTALLLSTAASPALEIVLDFSVDEQNYNWFDPTDSDGLARRQSLESAAAFLSTIIRDDDWNQITSFNTSINFSDLSESTINDLDGSPISGTSETDGAGYAYSIPTSNRPSLPANTLVVYVGAFNFDSGTSSHAKGGWGSYGDRNGASSSFNCWGGRLWFDLNNSFGSTWYWGQNPGINPTNNYGTQDPDKTPSGDISTDNWDWSTSSMEWKGFHLSTIDGSASGKSDIYGVGIHELLHVLGLTSSNWPTYLGATGGFAYGTNVVAEYGGPVPQSGGHFASGVQSEVWESAGIISEVTLDPTTTTGNRKYLTKLDAAALRDLGYDVASTWSEVAPTYDLTITPAGSFPKLDWTDTPSSESIVSWSTDLMTWNPISAGTANTWTDTVAFGTKRFYKVTD